MLLHEIGHFVLSIESDRVIESFQNLLSPFIKRKKVASLSQKGPQQKNIQSKINQLQEFWGKKWLYEFFADLFGVWLCGPAYLSCFYDEMLEEEPKPYFINQNHPPYFTRIKLLILAAEKLGFQNSTECLTELKNKWKKTLPSSIESYNDYVFLTPEELIENCVETSFSLFRELRISKIKGRIDCLSEKIDLIVAARLIYEKKGEDYYEEWGKNILKSYSNIKQ